MEWAHFFFVWNSEGNFWIGILFFCSRFIAQKSLISFKMPNICLSSFVWQIAFFFFSLLWNWRVLPINNNKWFFAFIFNYHRNLGVELVKNESNKGILQASMRKVKVINACFVFLSSFFFCVCVCVRPFLFFSAPLSSVNLQSEKKSKRMESISRN